MATGEVYRASVLGSHSGTEIAIVTFHYRMKTDVDPTATIGAYLKTYWVDLIKTKQENTFRWDQINTLRVNTSPPISGSYTTGFPVVGSNAGVGGVHQIALVVKHGTQYAGRSYRGRHYIPALYDPGISGGLWGSTLVNGIQTYYDDMVAAVGAAGSNANLTWVVWSQKLLTFTPITYTVVRNNPGVQRRRRIGSGQ